MNPGFSPYQALLWIGASPTRIVVFLVAAFVVALCAPVGGVVIGVAVWRRVRRVFRAVCRVVAPWVWFARWSWQSRRAAEVFGLRYRCLAMPHRVPAHVPPQVLPSRPDECECDAVASDFEWFEAPSQAPLTLEGLIAECWRLHDREFGSAP